MNRLKKCLTYLVIIAIACICALNYTLFVFPNRFAPSGLNGICTMIQYTTGIRVSYLSLLVNIPLALLVFFRVSKPLAVRSMVYVVTFSGALLLFERVDLSGFAYATENGTSTILGPLVAGIIYGSCYAMLVRASAYSGGTDFVAALIHKSHPEKSIYYLIFTMNVGIALASYFVYDHEVEPVILCILYSFTSSTVSDRLAKNGRSAVRFEIITEHPQDIADAIIHQLHHSATLLPGKGMYLGKEESILICVVNKTQAVALSALIRTYPHTFAVVSQVGEVVGNFKHLTVEGKPEKELLDPGDGNTV
ncbi:MAG: YitT family protein [Firmicutes bacterium]|nr:YitT family protein [Bacillota bacterium]